MPLYEYFCEDCQKEFTLLQSADANKAETKCSECGSQKTQHKFSSFAPKIVGKPLADLQKPVTVDDFPNKDVFKLRPPRLRSEL
jgi:putative FmdB family regulatory protein